MDAIEVASAAETGLKAIDLDRLRSLSRLFIGDFLEGLDLDRSPNFGTWLTERRRRFSTCHTAILEQLAVRRPAGCDEASSYLEKWIEIARFDGRAHSMLLNALALQGKVGACEEHLAATARLFESEGLDFAPIRADWLLLKEVAPAQKRYAESALGQLVQAPTAAAEIASDTKRRASLAGMPFVEAASGGRLRGGLADGLTHNMSITSQAQPRDAARVA